MSTRSFIVMATPAGYRGIYCHWDGGLQSNGLTLLKHYSGEENHQKVTDLIALGNLSVLGKELGEKHDFEKHPEGVCTFYTRDRGDSGEVSVITNTFQEMVEYAERCDADYIYLNIDGHWLYALVSKAIRIGRNNTSGMKPLTAQACQRSIVESVLSCVTQQKTKGYVASVLWVDDKSGKVTISGEDKPNARTRVFTLVSEGQRKYVRFLGKKTLIG